MKTYESVEIWACFYIIIFVSTILGNILILVSIFRNPQLRGTMFILIGNLAMSDLLVGTVLIPYYLLMDGAAFESGLGVLPRTKYTCTAKVCVYVSCLGSSCIGLLIISIERYLTLRFPLKAKIYITKKRVRIAVAMCWLIVFVNGTLPLYVWNNFDENNTNCISDQIIAREYKLLINWELIFCLTVNFIMYACAIRIAYQNVLEWRRRNSSSGVIQRTKADREFHQIVTTVIVFGAFFLCWLPYICSAVVLTFHETPLTQFIRRCALIPGLANSGLNWIIYGYRNTTFRASFKSILTCRTSMQERNGSIQMSTSGQVNIQHL